MVTEMWLLPGACGMPNPLQSLPTPVIPPPPPTLVPTSTPTLIPTAIPTATPLPRVPLRIGIDLVPQRPQAGQEFVLRLAVMNTGGRPAHGVFIATSGPWERYTVLSVTPAGRVGRDAAGWHVASPLVIPAGSTMTLEVRARAEEPSDEQLTFAVREADPGEL
jgi:hypothetical protein